MSSKTIKILLIEDDPFLLSMYSTKFGLENFSVISADDGEKGWQMAEEVRPDIILLDILMPKMNGFEVLEKLKANKKTKNIPVILLTNLNQKDEIERGMTLGADDYLIKAHFMPSEVVEKIKKVLKLN
ncbi:response regulator [Candidatus Parcubacteria bacterium]|nr:response regulator [Candidatus Parcubacteria bacterium]